MNIAGQQTTTPTFPANRAQKRRARRGMDNIRERNGKYQVRFMFDGKATTRTFTSKADAQQFLDLKRGEALDGIHAEFYVAQQTTLRGAVQMTLDAYEAHSTDEDADDADAESASSAFRKLDRQEISRLRVFQNMKPYADLPILDIVPDDLEQLFRELEKNGSRGKPLKSDTVRLYQASLALVFKYLVKRRKWHFLANPMEVIEKAKPGAARTRRLTEGEEEALVAAFAEYGPNYVLTFLLLICTTLRMGELFSLSWEMVEEDLGRFTVPHCKGGTPRRPLSAELLFLLDKLPRDGALVIPITRHAFQEAWKRVVKELEIKNLRRHDLRREGLTRWGQRVQNIVALMSISGHKTMSQAQKYLRGTSDEARAQMDAAMQGDPYIGHLVKPIDATPKSVARHFFPETLTPPPQPKNSGPSGVVVPFPRSAARATTPAKVRNRVKNSGIRRAD